MIVKIRKYHAIIRFILDMKQKNNDKVGVCLLCQKENNVIKEIKMKNSNTTGLKKHLQKCHKKAFENLFGPKAINGTFILPEKQKTVDVFLNVSIGY